MTPFDTPREAPPETSLEAQIEAILFFRGEPITVQKLAKTLKSTDEAVGEALAHLEEVLRGRGLRLVRKENEVELRTAPEVAEIIETIRKEELSKDLGKAGLETLSIILYKGPVTRAQIDYIRGVNSTFVLRNLLIRGLIEKVPNPKDKRSFLYKQTMELLAFLGLSSIEGLPEYKEVKHELEIFAETDESR